MGNGAILHNWEAFTAFFLIFSFRVPWLPKKARLSHILGKVKEEEEPEGEVLGEESTGSISSTSQRPINKQFPLLPYTSAHVYHSTISFLDESEEEGVVQPLITEEEEVEVMQSWIEAGGFPAQPEEEAKGLLA